MTLACGNHPFHSIQSPNTLANSEPHQVTSHQYDTNYTPPMASAGYALCERNQLKLAVLCDIPSALEENSQWKENSQCPHNLATTNVRKWKLLDTHIPCETWACSRQRRQESELASSCKFAMRAVLWCTRAPSTGCSGRTSPWMTRRAPPHCQLMKTRDALQRTPATSPSLLPKHFKSLANACEVGCDSVSRYSLILGSLSSMRWSSCGALWLSDNVGMDECWWVASTSFHPL